MKLHEYVENDFAHVLSKYFLQYPELLGKVLITGNILTKHIVTFFLFHSSPFDYLVISQVTNNAYNNCKHYLSLAIFLFIC